MVSSMILSILPSTMSSMMKVRITFPLDSSICPSFTSRPIVLSRRSSCSSKTCSNYLENLLWKDQDLSALKVDLVEPAGDLVGRLEVRLDVHPVVLQRDLTHLVVTPWSWAHCKCAGLENGSVCILEIQWGIFLVQYISQTLPRIPDAPLSKNKPGRRSEIFETISKHLQLWIDIK